MKRLKVLFVKGASLGKQQQRTLGNNETSNGALNSPVNHQRVYFLKLANAA